MPADRFDTTYRRGDAITFVLKHKPFIDIGLPPSANEYRDASCVNISIYDPTKEEKLVFSGDMPRVPNRPGWYYFRYQTKTDMPEGLYTVIYKVITRIDGIDYASRQVEQFRLISDKL